MLQVAFCDDAVTNTLCLSPSSSMTVLLVDETNEVEVILPSVDFGGVKTAFPGSDGEYELTDCASLVHQYCCAAAMICDVPGLDSKAADQLDFTENRSPSSFSFVSIEMDGDQGAAIVQTAGVGNAAGVADNGLFDGSGLLYEDFEIK